jgi:two-component system cell cycle sensor histidine kinase/response regulator CckA
MQVVGRFAAGVAHDFNNLLTTIQAAAEAIASRAETDPASRDDARQIRAAARRGAALVRHLLGFTREASASPQRLDLLEALADLLPLLHHLLGSAIRLETELDHGPLPVRIDPTALDQVVLNLAANARDAMAGGGVLTLCCKAVHRDGVGCARLELRDTGTGIAPSVLPYIFEPFFTTRSNKGTGLGLATVREIVEAAGGTVHAESTLGAGTRMQVLLPLAEEPTHVVADGSVLLVDDEPTALRLAEQALTTWGWRVRTAPSAEAALALAEKEGFAAVVTDMELPGDSGATLLAALRARPGSERLPGVILSGHTEAGLRQNPEVRALLAAPATTLLLAKPYPLPELRARLEAAVAAG